MPLPQHPGVPSPWVLGSQVLGCPHPGDLGMPEAACGLGGVSPSAWGRCFGVGSWCWGTAGGCGGLPGSGGGIWGAAGGFGCRIKGRGGSEHPALGDRAHPGDTERTVPCRAVPNCAVLFCAITCCAMPNCAVPSCAVPCRAELCRAVPGLAGPRRRRQGWGLSGGFVICSSLIPRRDFCLPLSRSTAEII